MRCHIGEKLSIKSPQPINKHPGYKKKNQIKKETVDFDAAENRLVEMKKLREINANPNKFSDSIVAFVSAILQFVINFKYVLSHSKNLFDNKQKVAYSKQLTLLAKKVLEQYKNESACPQPFPLKKWLANRTTSINDLINKINDFDINIDYGSNLTRRFQIKNQLQECLSALRFIAIKKIPFNISKSNIIISSTQIKMIAIADITKEISRKKNRTIKKNQ